MKICRFFLFTIFFAKSIFIADKESITLANNNLLSSDVESNLDDLYINENNIGLTESESAYFQSFTDTIAGIKVEMIAISGGIYNMGSELNESNRYNNETLHEVEIIDFYIAKYEVSQLLWSKVMWKSNSNPSYFIGDNLPVENISWKDIQLFLERVNRTPYHFSWREQKNSNKKYRLPTEAEWEYACRANTKTPFNTGKCLTGELANYDVRSNYEECSTEENNDFRTTPVGSYPPNAWGLCDMHGNVAEWCNDWYSFQLKSEHSNPQGPQEGNCRVVRGGSYLFGSQNCRSSYRGNYNPNGNTKFIGFRLAMTR